MSKSRAKRLSNDFFNALSIVAPDLRQPDNEERQREYPDVYLPSANIALELKSVSKNLRDSKRTGEQLYRLTNKILFGTGPVNLTEKEFKGFSRALCGGLKRSISKAESQLNNFRDDNEDMLEACCLFVDVADYSIFDWGASHLPSRDMVRSVVEVEMKKRSIDAYLVFTSQMSEIVACDLMHKVYRDSYLVREFSKLFEILPRVLRRLPYEFDFSEAPVEYFEPS